MRMCIASFHYRKLNMGKPNSQRNAKKQSHPTRRLEDLSNHQIVTLAVAESGGSARAVDTEDVAIKANELVPGRFTWRRYPKQISLEHIRVFLSDAKKPKNGALVTGTGDSGWMLTPAGADFVGAHVQQLQASGGSGPRLSNEEKRWRARERRRLLAVSATRRFLAGERDGLTLRDAEQFFRIDAYVTGTPRLRKIDRTVNLLGDDPDLAPVITFMVQLLQSEGCNAQ